jgi:hypothetical protein
VKQACKLKGGDNSIDMHLIGAAAERIRNEIAKEREEESEEVDLAGGSGRLHTGPRSRWIWLSATLNKFEVPKD